MSFIVSEDDRRFWESLSEDEQIQFEMEEQERLEKCWAEEAEREKREGDKAYKDGFFGRTILPRDYTKPI